MRSLARPVAIVTAALLALAGIALVSAPAHAATCTRYVANGGNDNNSGTSLSSPWLTVSKAVSQATAGTVVCVRAGSYNERVVISGKAGTASAPIIFQKYTGDSGAATINGSGITANTNGRIAGFLITDSSYITVQGFDIANFQTTSTSRVTAGIFALGSSTNLSILGNKIHDIKGQCSGNCNAHGIAVYGESGSTANSGTVIDSNEVYNNQLGRSEAVVVNGNVTGWTISNNYVHENNNIGIDAIGYEPTCSCGESNRARNGTIVGNTVVNTNDGGGNNSSYDSYGDAAGIYVDGGSTITIERNVVKTSNLGIELASEHTGKNTSNITVRNNFVSGSKHAGFALGGADPDKGGTQNAVFVNNTLYNNSVGGSEEPGEIWIQNNTSGTTVRNNILVAGSSKHYLYSDSAVSGYTTDNNLFFAGTTAGTTGTWTLGGITYNTAADYKQQGRDANSQFGVDPKLVSTTDLHLQSTSPAKNAGASLTTNGSTDIDGQARVQGGAVDKGADEVG